MSQSLFVSKRTNEQRLNIVIGQLNSLKKTLSNDRYDCLAIINQVKAARSGLDAILEKILVEELDKCLKKNKNKPEVKKLFGQIIRR